MCIKVGSKKHPGLRSVLEIVTSNILWNFQMVHPRCVYITSLVEMHVHVHVQHPPRGLLNFLFGNHTRPEDGPIEEDRNMSSLLHI